MRYSIAAGSLFTALAVASPLHKKGLEIPAPEVEVATNVQVQVVTDVVMVTITAEPVIVTATAPVVTQVAAATTSIHHYGYHTYTYVQQAPPQVHSSSSSSEAVVVTVTQSSSSVAPVYTKTSSSVAPPVYTSSSAAPPASTTPAATAATGLEATAVSVHSNARASHSASAMAWNATLAGYAAKEGSCTKFEHILSQGAGAYGQNIAVAGHSDPNAYDDATALKNAMDDWYNEESLYNNLYGVASPSEAVGDFLHFTQMVWLKSDTVGCAVIRCGTDNTIFSGMYLWYSVCNYYPAGNVLGSFDKNVLA
ncbi:scp-like extracellular protein [Rutstroemia sp. NJR-2017a WRK4]|nr:scp-like extracellular protein [Rutstroemia sp. NJR-2017a WRK4]